MTIFMLLAWRKCSQSQGLSLKSFWGRGRTGLALSLEVPEWVYQRPECVWPRPRWALTWQRERLGRFNLQKGAVTLRDSEQYQGSPEWPDWYLPSQSLARWVSKLEHRSEGAPDLGAALRRAGRVIAALPRGTRGSKLLLWTQKWRMPAPRVHALCLHFHALEGVWTRVHVPYPGGSAAGGAGLQTAPARPRPRPAPSLCSALSPLAPPLGVAAAAAV